MALTNDRAAVIAGLLGLSSTTIFYSMNTTINYLTMPAILLGRTPASPPQQSPFFVPSTSTPSSSHSQIVRQFQESLVRGGKVGQPSTIFSAATLFTAAYYSPSDSMQRKLYGVAATISLAVFPATIYFIVPTNIKLHGMAEEATKRMREGAGEMSDGEGARMMELLRKWIYLSKVRAAGTMVASALVLIALASG